MDEQGRARVNVPQDLFSQAASLTGKSKPADVFKELVTIAQRERERIEQGFEESRGRPNGDKVGMAITNVMGLEHGRQFYETVQERKYWDTRLAKARTLTAEFHLMREIAKVPKDELELIVEVPKRMQELPDTFEEARCYKCHQRGHYPSQCPETPKALRY